MNRFSIRDIENLTGIKAHTLRIWEQRYQILMPKRTETNIRYYDAEDLRIALNIALLNSYGYKISRIGDMSLTEMGALIDQISDDEFKLQHQVNQLISATLDIDMAGFERMLSNYDEQYGLERMLEELIFNFLEKIGLMWMTNRIFPAQEHLVSNIIYRKIAVAIEHLPGKEIEVDTLLFLPEGEIHDIGLLYAFYILKKHHKKPLYLGPNSPLSEVQFIVDKMKPSNFYLHLTSPANDFDAVKYIKRISNLWPDIHMYISGSVLSTRKFPNLPNIHYLYTLSETKERLIHL